MDSCGRRANVCPDRMELNIKKLLAYYEATQDPKALDLLDVCFTRKVVEPIQLAFLRKRGALCFQSMWLPNGSIVWVRMPISGGAPQSA